MLVLCGEFSGDDKAVGGVLVGERVASAGHQDESGAVRGSEELRHVDVGLGEGGDGSDAVGLVVIGERSVESELAEGGKDGGGVADQECGGGGLAVAAGEFGGGDKFVVGGEGEGLADSSVVHSSGLPAQLAGSLP